MSVLVVESVPAQVMGDANYMPSPCVIVCPFAGPKCPHGIFRMNGGCKPSQQTGCKPSSKTTRKPW